MAKMLEMPRVSECSVTACSYNHDGCHAFAITVAEEATCATFVEIPTKGGVDSSGFVGACQEATCRHNVDLECQAPAIQVGAGSADCQTFEPRAESGL
jgi:hypothetical protein